MKSKSIIMMLVMISAYILTTYCEAPVLSLTPPVPCPDGPFEKFGPRVDRLTFVVSGGVSAECDDFQAGLMDVMDWSAPAERWTDWFADPEIVMGYFGESAPIYLALNLMRWPLGHGDQFPEGWTGYPAGYISNHDLNLWSKDPSSDLPVGNANMTWIDYNCQRCLDARQFRRGLAHMVDRASQVAYTKGAVAALGPSLFWPDLKNWENPNTPAYDYDLAAAVAAFEAGGFKDWDGDGTMEYSPGHNGAVKEELPTMVFYTRVDDEHRIFAGQMISADMKVLGIPHDLKIASYPEVSQKVWAEYDYDIYIEYWDWDPLPNLYSEWFASRMDIYPEPWGNNEHRYHSKEFDIPAALFTNALSTEAARQYCYEMQMILHRDAAAIPFYAYVGYNAHRTHYGSWTGEEKYAGRLWEGMDNVAGEGFYAVTEAWTALNAHPQGFEKGGTLRMGLNIDAQMLDVVDAMYFYDYMVFDNIYDCLVRFNPWDLTKFEPWLAESYNVGTWQHPTAGTCTAINFTLIPGILWQDGKPMTAEDVGFSYGFHKDCKSAYYTYAKDFDSYKIYPNTPKPGKETIEIRFKVQSWMATYWCYQVPIIPRHIWSDQYERYCPVHQVYERGPGVKGSPAYVPEAHDAVIGTGPFRFFKDGVVGRVYRVPGEYLYLEANPLYFRKYIGPDVCDSRHQPGMIDKLVDLDDFLEVAKPGNIFARENPDGTWPTPPGAWGPYCDVNRDGKIGVGDLGEIGVNFGKSWPPLWYDWTWKPT